MRAGWIAAGLLAGACAGTVPEIGTESPPPTAEPQRPNTLGAGAARVALILPLSAAGNAGPAAESMRNAAELALAEFANAEIQLIVKDDGGTTFGAQLAAQAAVAEGAEIVLGPLFSHTVAAAGQVTRARGVPMIAFSNDSSVAARGIYLLSFSPESDVERVVTFAATRGKRSYLALLPDNAYGKVVEARFQEVVADRGGRVAGIERYPAETPTAEPVKRLAAALRQADSLFLAADAEVLPQLGQLLAASSINSRKVQFVGTSLWNDTKLFADPNLAGAWFAAPDATIFRSFAQRYRARFGREPVRTASLAYDAVSLTAALVKAQGRGSFTEQTLTNPSGFNGIDGVFRFRSDGTCERALAVFEIKGGKATVISPAPKSFTAAAL